MLAGDEDVGVRGTDAADEVENRLHDGRIGEKGGARLGTEQAVFGFEAGSLAKGLSQVDLRAQYGKQALIFPGLLKEVACTAAHGFDSNLDTAPRGHDDDGKGGVEHLDA